MITGRSVLTESAVLGVFVLGLLVSRRFGRRWHPAEILVMYAVGLLFEILTAHMWQYHNIFLVFPFSVDNDISVLFPLGWAGWVMTNTTLAEKLWRRMRVKSWWGKHLVLMAVWLVIGDVAETTFYRIGMIEYLDNASGHVNFLLGKFPGLPPTVVLVGYIGIPPLMSQWMRWLERGLSKSATGVRKARV